MTALAELIRATQVSPGQVALFYLGQAGFAFKTAAGKLLYLDPYLSDVANRLFGFKRMQPPVLDPEELQADLILSTHAHVDHLDPEALAVAARQPATHFVGALDCAEPYRELGLPPERYTLLARGQSVELAGVKLRATFADHGDLAPDALGLVLDFGGVTVYNVGDTALTPEPLLASLGEVRPDVMIAPLNGAFGNLNEAEACRLGALVKPRLLIGAHFWMFVEHGGDPARFLREAEGLPAGTRAIIMAPGERLIYPEEAGQ